MKLRSGKILAQQTVQPENLNRCVICRRDFNHVIIQHGNCKHSAYCMPCFVELVKSFFKNDFSFPGIKCPICKHFTSHMLNIDISDFINRFVDYDEKFFTMIKMYLEKTSFVNFDMKTLKEIVSEYYINKHTNDGRMNLLKVSECDELLRIAQKFLVSQSNNNNYQILNLLVCSCREPWDVEPKLGNYGICYHGNMGETHDKFRLITQLQNNHRVIMSQFSKLF